MKFLLVMPPASGRGSTCPNQMSSEATRDNERSLNVSTLTHDPSPQADATAPPSRLRLSDLLAFAAAIIAEQTRADWQEKKSAETGALEVESAFWGNREALESHLEGSDRPRVAAIPVTILNEAFVL